LDFAVRRIELQIQRLDNASDRFSERDKSIFVRIVEAYSKHDMPRANVFANELAEIRKWKDDNAWSIGIFILMQRKNRTRL
jgi:division protein CdvB (Snf7/Vps24/ESCRT-III family)